MEFLGGIVLAFTWGVFTAWSLRDERQSKEALRSAGVMTPNEVRAHEDLPPKPEGSLT